MEKLLLAAMEAADRPYSGMGFGFCRRDDGFESHFFTDDFSGPWAWGKTLGVSAQAALAALKREDPMQLNGDTPMAGR